MDEDRRKKVREIANKLTKDLANQGKIIQGGWRAYELMVLPEKAGATQRRETRLAFFGGAQHLWASIIVSLDPGTEETPMDLRRMDLIQKELDDFILEMKREMAIRGGH